MVKNAIRAYRALFVGVKVLAGSQTGARRRSPEVVRSGMETIRGLDFVPGSILYTVRSRNLKTGRGGFPYCIQCRIVNRQKQLMMIATCRLVSCLPLGWFSGAGYGSEWVYFGTVDPLMSDIYSTSADSTDRLIYHWQSCRLFVF